MKTGSKSKRACVGVSKAKLGERGTVVLTLRTAKPLGRRKTEGRSPSQKPRDRRFVSKKNAQKPHFF